MKEETVCSMCKRKYIYRKNHGTTKVCSKCLFLRIRIKNKIKCVKYKGGKCSMCGYNKCLRALTFHHVNPETKKFGISAELYKRWKDLQLELDKCILVCINCHSEIHSKSGEEK